MKIGDKVKYKREFLRSIGVYSGNMPFARGTIVELVELGQTTILARIDWLDCLNGEIPAIVNSANLTLANNPERV